MTRIMLGIVAGLIAGAAVTWTVLKHGEHEGKPETEAHPEESRILHTNDQTYVKLDAEAQAKVGLKLAPIEAATLPREINATGRVLDPAPLAALLTEGATARAALEASRKELERLKLLAQDQNTSARALEAATAALERDQIAADAARLKLASGWGKAIAGQKDLAAFVAPLVAQEAAIVRLDVPLGNAPDELPIGARVAAVSAPESPVDTHFLGPAPDADPLTQGRGFLCLVRRGGFVPGAAVTGWLILPGQPSIGVLLPRDAVVRHEGEAFVYVQAGTNLFLRREIELEHPTAKGWFIDAGLKPGDQVVTVGAQQLLSEELKGEGGEE